MSEAAVSCASSLVRRMGQYEAFRIISDNFDRLATDDETKTFWGEVLDIIKRKEVI